MEVHGVAMSLQLATIAEIGARITACTTVDDIVRTLVTEGRWLLTFGRCTMAIVLPGGEQFQIHAPDQAAPNERASRTFDLPQGVIGRAITRRLSLHLDQPNAAWTDDHVGAASLLPGASSILILPLLADGVVLGTLNFSAAQPSAYPPTTVSVARLLALQVTSAVRNALLLADLDGSENVILSLAHAIEAKDPYTEGHCQRIAELAVAFGKALDFAPTHLRDLRMAAFLHDVGKIAVPEAVLGKPGPLTAEEYLTLQAHPITGAAICAPLRSARGILPAIRHHHERWDGNGYPDRLAGEAIPLDARIIAILDSYDAMTSDRPYRPGMSHERAVAILRANVGPQWDPQLIARFLTLIDPASTVVGPVPTALAAAS